MPNRLKRFAVAVVAGAIVFVAGVLVTRWFHEGGKEVSTADGPQAEDKKVQSPATPEGWEEITTFR